MAKQFYGNGFACGVSANACSSSVRTATADNATAAPIAANRPAVSSGGPPTAAIKGVPRDDSIIEIASGNIDAAFGNGKPA
jgi:hypothetical protein